MSECKKLDDEALKKTSGGMIVGDMSVITKYDIDKMYCGDYSGSKTGNERACRNCSYVSIHSSNVYCLRDTKPDRYNQTSN